jgi:hypothetical protein
MLINQNILLFRSVILLALSPMRYEHLYTRNQFGEVKTHQPITTKVTDTLNQEYQLPNTKSV